MSEELKAYYQRELAYIQRSHPVFADEHPAVAHRLGLGDNRINDPHVEILMRAFAHLNARTRRKLDDELPEITDALLDVLYPHYQRPIPSMAIVGLALVDAQAKGSTGPKRVPRETPLRTRQEVDGVQCEYRTCSDVAVWPIAVDRASFASSSGSSRRLRPESRVTIQVSSRSEGASLRDLGVERLRFYLADESEANCLALYEALLRNALRVRFTSSRSDASRDDERGGPTFEPRECLEAAGFGPDECLLPYSARSFPGYRLLAEYFAFPQKFLFVDVVLPRETIETMGRSLVIEIDVAGTSRDLEAAVNAGTFRLGCVAVVNLFRPKLGGAQITLDHRRTSYRLEPDARGKGTLEVYSIDRVVAIDGDHESEYHPLYAVHHRLAPADVRTYYLARRVEADDGATDQELTFADLDLDPSSRVVHKVHVETTCTNRDLPARLPAGSGFVLRDGDRDLHVDCAYPPTRPLRPARGPGAAWAVLSHLVTNHVPLTEADGSPDVLRQILTLYDHSGHDDGVARIAAVRSVTSRRATARVWRDGEVGVCRGHDVDVVIDPAPFVPGESFLFASVLDRFLGLYCSVNSFTRLTLLGPEQETLHRWPPRTGQHPLL